jgi:hypothetical protein
MIKLMKRKEKQATHHKTPNEVTEMVVKKRMSSEEERSQRDCVKKE